MSDYKLRTAFLGLCPDGRKLLETAAKNDHFKICAVADSDVDLAEKIAERYDCQAFGDYRQLVIAGCLDALIVAAPIYLCDEYIRIAMQNKCSILKLVPVANDFGQTAELVRLARKSKVRFITGGQMRFYPSFVRLKEYVASEGVDNINMVTAVCNMPGERPVDDSRRWLSDPQLAGGGVLLHQCYEVIDQIVLNFGMPGQVYSIRTSYAPDKQQRLSITEDSAIITMKYSDTLMVNLAASRVFGPSAEQLKLQGSEKSLTITPDSWEICDKIGEIIEQNQYEADKDSGMGEMLESFALSLLTPDKTRPREAEKACLNTMALIESAYLSAKTAMPEEPGRILERINHRKII